LSICGAFIACATRLVHYRAAFDTYAAPRAASTCAMLRPNWRECLGLFAVTMVAGAGIHGPMTSLDQFGLRIEQFFVAEAFRGDDHQDQSHVRFPSDSRRRSSVALEAMLCSYLCTI